MTTTPAVAESPGATADPRGLYRLSCPIKNYDWGSVDALPRLLGRPADGRPQAEMWVGAHPSAPSIATDQRGRAVPLDRLLESDPVLLHDGHPWAWSRLPFLLKVLAPERPLSLQVHPDSARAAARFAEQRPGYQDPWHKPEMIYALEPFEALCGFTRADRAADLLDCLGVPALAGIIDRLTGRDGIRQATHRLLSMDSQQAGDLVAAVVRAARSRPEPAYATAVHLAGFHPTDPGVIVSMLLNRVTLAPGEAMFVPPNTVHTYIRGVGIEVMATSDNVLRAGLTGKRIDVAELLDTTDYSPAPPRLVAPRAAGRHEQVFAPQVDEFRLSVIRCESRTECSWDDRRPRTVLCVSGAFSLTVDGVTVALAQGEAGFVGAGARAVHVAGAGTLVGAMPAG
ncbi:MAG: mannose-6-phosphate isomerase, class I [Pseudonocardiaceae bacterium]|nr:mannose-6-phosphate isomerase, class I [Pseudonocardiaceae bacterium]